MAPMRLEARAIRRGRPPGRVRRTGMGPRRARAAIPGLLRDSAGALLVLGFGGGLGEDCAVGEVVVAQEVHGPGGLRAVCADAPALARALHDHGLKVRTGVVASLTRPALGATRTRLRAYGAVAVDMESAWLAAGAAGRPFSVVRVLCDTPGSERDPLGALGGIARCATVLGEVAAALHAWAPAA